MVSAFLILVRKGVIVLAYIFFKHMVMFSLFGFSILVILTTKFQYVDVPMMPVLQNVTIFKNAYLMTSDFVAVSFMHGVELRKL